MKIKKLTGAILSLVLVSLFLIPSAQSGVIPKNDRPLGKSYGQHAKAWWRWAAGVPMSQNPFFVNTQQAAAQNQSGDVFYLVGSFTGDTTRNITISKKKYLFFPLVFALADAVGVDTSGMTQEQIDEIATSGARDFADKLDSLHATLDGQSLSDNLFKFRADTRAFDVDLPSDPDESIYTALYGITIVDNLDPVALDGYWLFLDKLSPGQHELTFGGGSTFYGFSLSVTYIITVTNN